MDNSVLIHSVLRARSPDTGLEHSTSQICFITTYHPMQFHSHNLPSLCGQHSLSAIRNTLPHHEKKTQILSVCYSYIALIAFLEPSTLFQAALDTPRMFCHCVIGKVLAALTSEASWVNTLLGAVALGYSICVLKLDIKNSSHTVSITETFLI
jgi:hypothetical protein